MTTFSDPDGRRTDADDATARDPLASASRRDIAVALGHDRDGGDLPRVIATGTGAVARQILQIAFDRGIKVREDADLAEVLAAVEVDSEIPLVAFAAVAEILSYIYRAQDAQAEAPSADAESLYPQPGDVP